MILILRKKFAGSKLLFASSKHAAAPVPEHRAKLQNTTAAMPLLYTIVPGCLFAGPGAALHIPYTIRQPCVQLPWHLYFCENEACTRFQAMVPVK